MSTLREPPTVPAAQRQSLHVPDYAPRRRRRASWLAPLLVAACLLGVGGLAYRADVSYAYADEVSGWSRAVGVIVAHPYDHNSLGPAVVFYDAKSQRRVYLLAPNDTDDMPVGSLGYMLYDPNSQRMEIQGVAPNAARAWLSLCLLSFGGAAAAGVWWWWDRRRARQDETTPTEEPAAA